MMRNEMSVLFVAIAVVILAVIAYKAVNLHFEHKATVLCLEHDKHPRCWEAGHGK